ncbi:MAG: AI-2E family transporter [Phycisphaerae bacterium]
MSDAQQSSAEKQQPNPQPADWTQRHVWQIQPVRDLLILAAILGLVWLGYRLSIVTVPLLLALMLAYLVEPLVKRVTRARWASRSGMALVLIVMGGLAVLLPVTLGVGYGVAQGTQLVRRTTQKVDLLVKSVQTPDDAVLRERLPEKSWRRIRDYIVEQEERRKALEAATAAEMERVLGQGHHGEPATSEPSSDSQVPFANADEVPPSDATKADVPRDVNAATATTAGEETKKKNASESARLTASRSYLPPEVYTGLMWLVERARENAESLGKRALEAGGGAIGGAVSVFGSIGAVVFGAALTAFFFFFFVTGWGKVTSTWQEVLPQRNRERVLYLLGRMDKVIAAFIRGRITVCASMIVLYTLLYWFIGVPAPFVMGPLTGLLTLVPYAAGMSAPIAMLMMWLSPGAVPTFRDQWWWIIGAPLVVLAIAQALDDWVLTPLIQGKATDLPMPTIIFASIAGGSLAGFYGLLLAIPIAACIKILVEEIVVPHVKAWAKGERGDLLPVGRGRD